MRAPGVLLGVACLGLLCLGAVTAGRTATASLPTTFRFTDATRASDLGSFVHTSGAADRKDYIFEAKGGGVAALDIDGDGSYDIGLFRCRRLE